MRSGVGAVLGVGSGVPMGVGAGLVTNKGFPGSLSFPAASTACTSTTCCVPSSLNQSRVASVSLVVLHLVAVQPDPVPRYSDVIGAGRPDQGRLIQGCRPQLQVGHRIRWVVVAFISGDERGAGPRSPDRLDCGTRFPTGDDRSVRGTLDRPPGVSDVGSADVAGERSPVVGRSTYEVVVVVAVGVWADGNTVGAAAVASVEPKPGSPAGPSGRPGRGYGPCWARGRARRSRQTHSVDHQSSKSDGPHRVSLVVRSPAPRRRERGPAGWRQLERWKDRRPAADHRPGRAD